MPPEPSEVRFVLETTRLEVAARVWGPERGMPVLALHGWLDNAASFDRLAPLLPEARLVAVDLPGHGLSQHRPHGVPYHFIDWLADVVDIARALGWERFVLMGHSMGAGIGSLFAGAFPDRLLGLVLLEGLGPLAEPAEAAPDRVAAGVLERSRLWARKHPVYKTREEAETLLAEVAGHQSPESARLLVERGMQPVRGGWAWRHDGRLRGGWPLRLTEEQVLAFLGRIRVPALLVWARNGYPFDKAEMRRRAAAIAGLVAHELEGGHHVHLDAPERVAPPVRELLARAAAGSALGG